MSVYYIKRANHPEVKTKQHINHQKINYHEKSDHLFRPCFISI